MLAYETEALAAEAETKAFRVETEAKTKTFSLKAEARPRRLKFQPRQDRAKALLHLKTASRPRRQDRNHITVKNMPFNAMHSPPKGLLSPNVTGSLNLLAVQIQLWPTQISHSEIYF